MTLCNFSQLQMCTIYIVLYCYYNVACIRACNTVVILIVSVLMAVPIVQSLLRPVLTTLHMTYRISCTYKLLLCLAWQTRTVILKLPRKKPGKC